MGAPSKDIKDMLEADSSLGLTFVTDLFIAAEPDKPANCVTIFDTSTQGPDITLDEATNANAYDYTSVQIRVRNTDYFTGWNLIESIKNKLHGQAQEEWGGYLYSVIYCSSGPAFLDRDEKNRPRFIINFKIQRR